MKKKLLYILYQPYKWLVFIPFFVLNTLFFGIMAVAVSSVFGKKAGSYFGGVLWSRLNAILTPIRVEVTGREHIASKTSYVVIPNHQSYFDIFLVYGWLGIDIKWIMKKELAKIPGIGFGSKKVGHIFIDRSHKREALTALNDVRNKLVNGTSVVIFPEGTRSRDGQLGKFKRGAFKLAKDLELPLLPVTINGTKNILPAGTLDLFPGKVSMIIHPPIDSSRYDGEDLKPLMECAARLISGELILQTADRLR
ncbi:MAG: 1-acyl-sn-glycerol-3-phosphate acyltransferase [Bacteroidales bacterium]|nr:1-acyl-sn-glycerol-3-phosphate acyltransferase [Bacteroidales bacterium]